MLMGTSSIGQNAINQQVPVSTNYANATTDLNSQLAQLGLSSQADKAAKRQSAFSNLANIAGMAAGPVAGWGAGAGLWGGMDPSTGIRWNSGRVM